MKNKVIIFDMDGVIFDTINFSKKNFMQVYPGITDKMYKDIFCGNFYDEVKKYSNIRIVETEEEKTIRQKLYTETKSRAPIFKGIKELLEELNENGYILVLGTGAHDRNCLSLLEYSNIAGLFDLIATAEFSKSKVEKFKLIQKKYNLSKDNILFITDTLGDIKEADISGILTVAVTWGFHDREYFALEKHDNLVKIVDNVKELSDYIKDYFKIK